MTRKQENTIRQWAEKHRNNEGWSEYYQNRLISPEFDREEAMLSKSVMDWIPRDGTEEPATETPKGNPDGLTVGQRQDLIELCDELLSSEEDLRHFRDRQDILYRELESLQKARQDMVDSATPEVLALLDQGPVYYANHTFQRVAGGSIVVIRTVPL